MTTPNPDHTHPEDLRPVLSCGTWTVEDGAGARWWPSEEAAREIALSGDARQCVMRICAEQPMRGEWRS